MTSKSVQKKLNIAIEALLDIKVNGKAMIYSSQGCARKAEEALKRMEAADAVEADMPVRGDDDPWVRP